GRMSQFTITCPACQKVLKISQAPRAGQRFLCRKCGYRFDHEPIEPVSEAVSIELLPDEEPPPVEGAPRIRRNPVMLAALGALLFAGISVGAAVLLTKGSGNGPVAQKTEAEKPTAPKEDPAQQAKLKEQQEQEKRRAAFDKLMADGNAALAKQHYE